MNHYTSSILDKLCTDGMYVCGEPIITAPVSTNDLSISIENIRKAITPKTKAIILNTPSNPSGRIISDDSIQQIAQIAIEMI